MPKKYAETYTNSPAYLKYGKCSIWFCYTLCISHALQNKNLLLPQGLKDKIKKNP